MLLAVLSLPWRIGLFVVAGFCGGVANSIAGGGSFFTFPAMLWAGVPAVGANISSSIAVLPGYGGALAEFRGEIRDQRHLIVRLLPACAAGTVLGAWLLLHSSPTTFRAVVPWLVGGSTLIYWWAPRWTRRLATLEREPRLSIHLVAGVFALSIYGGYFGSGVGIMILALLSLTLGGELRSSQGIRLALALTMNSLTTIIFIHHGSLYYGAIAYSALGFGLGGFAGALLIARLSALAARRVILAIGVVTTLRLVTS